MTAVGRKLAKDTIYCQFAVTLVTASLFAITLGKYAAGSAFLGGFTCILPSLIFALFAFRYAGARQNKLVVRQFSNGSKLKFLATMVLFMAAFQWQDLQVLPMLVCYIITMVAQWPIILIISRVKT
ncbi:MAG: ATP synthase protein I [Paraglaciecola sp.]